MRLALLNANLVIYLAHEVYYVPHFGDLNLFTRTCSDYFLGHQVFPCVLCFHLRMSSFPSSLARPPGGILFSAIMANWLDNISSKTRQG